MTSETFLRVFVNGTLFGTFAREHLWTVQAIVRILRANGFYVRVEGLA